VLQLLAIEFVTKLAGGLILLAAPLTAIKLLGLPRSETAFWPRLLGLILIGIALAAYMDASVRLGHGIGLPGLMVVNLIAAFGLGAMLALQKGPTPLRGRVVLWGLAALLAGLGLFEIAYL
jgi:hypothetical protein